MLKNESPGGRSIICSGILIDSEDPTMDKHIRSLKRKNKVDPQDRAGIFRSYLEQRRVASSNGLESLSAWCEAGSDGREQLCVAVEQQLKNFQLLGIKKVCADGFIEGPSPCCRGHGCKLCGGSGLDSRGLQAHLPVASYQQLKTGLIFHLIPGVTAEDPQPETGLWPEPLSPFLISAEAIYMGAFIAKFGADCFGADFSRQQGAFKRFRELLTSFELRIPTKNEWVHGFRGGTLTHYPWGDESRWETWGEGESDMGDKRRDYVNPFGLINIGSFIRDELIIDNEQPALVGFRDDVVTFALPFDGSETMTDLKFFVRPVISIPCLR
jgi:hypothetical protein